VSMSEQEGGAGTLEGALGRLDEISARLDRNDLELDEALALYEEGVRLIRVAEGVLNSAETKIERLRADAVGQSVEPGEPRP
jgi:exodeoxyribonuclease VII small subunit